jgi:hypothetical protein
VVAKYCQEDINQSIISDLQEVCTRESWLFDGYHFRWKQWLEVQQPYWIVWWH